MLIHKKFVLHAALHYLCTFIKGINTYHYGITMRHCGTTECGKVDVI